MSYIKRKEVTPKSYHELLVLCIERLKKICCSRYVTLRCIVAKAEPGSTFFADFFDVWDPMLGLFQ